MMNSYCSVRSLVPIIFVISLTHAYKLSYSTVHILYYISYIIVGNLAPVFFDGKLTPARGGQGLSFSQYLSVCTYCSYACCLVFTVGRILVSSAVPSSVVDPGFSDADPTSRLVSHPSLIFLIFLFKFGNTHLVIVSDTSF